MTGPPHTPSASAEALQRILDITRELVQPLKLETVLTHGVDAGRDILDAERGSVFLYDQETDERSRASRRGPRPCAFPPAAGSSASARARAR